MVVIDLGLACYSFSPLTAPPGRYNLICFTPIGVPEAWPQAPAKKALADIVVFVGFKEIGPYRYNPVKGALFMELKL